METASNTENAVGKEDEKQKKNSGPATTTKTTRKRKSSAIKEKEKEKEKEKPPAKRSKQTETEPTTKKKNPYNVNNTKLADRILKRKDNPKLYCCLDHDTKDTLGACTFVVASNEKDAVKYLDKALTKSKFKPSSDHPYTLLRLPTYRECVYFASSKKKELLKEQIIKEDTILLKKMNEDDIDRLKVFYILSEQDIIRGGAIVCSETYKNALRNLIFSTSTKNASLSKDVLGLYMSDEYQDPIEINEMEMVSGTVISLKPSVPVNRRANKAVRFQ